MSVALLCPGQGAQRVGMGKDVAEAFPAARDIFAAIDDALGFALSAVMWEGPEDLLTRTDHAQHTAPMYFQHLTDWGSRLKLVPLQFFIHWRFSNASSDPESEPNEENTRQERQSPTPRLELFGR